MIAVISLLILASTVTLAEQELKYSCPEVDVDFEAHDVEVVNYVSSWQDCGKFVLHFPVGYYITGVDDPKTWEDVWVSFHFV